MKRLSTSVGRRLLPGVGQGPYDIMSEGARDITPPILREPPSRGVSPPGTGYNCPYPEKLAGGTTGALLTTTSGQINVFTPGFFCPEEITLFASVDIQDVRVTFIRVALENQIISGELSGAIFDNSNCCPLACLKCLCSPSIPLEIGIKNNDAMTQTVRAVVKGYYADACDNPNVDAMYHLPAGCTPKDKFLGFDVVIPASGSITIPVTTPGRFCPRVMFITGPDIATVTLAQVSDGLENELIVPIPAEYFEVRECDCRVICFKCICAPGVVENFTFTGTEGDTIHVDLVGEYTKVC